MGESIVTRLPTGAWRKTWRHRTPPKHEAELWLEAAEHGLAPKVIAVHEDGLTTAHGGVTLETVLTETDPDIEQLRSSLVTLLLRLHRIGIAHRDVNRGNVVVEQGKLRLIDFEVSVRNRGRVAYDLHGPSSHFPIPSGGEQTWWDGALGIGRFLGSLHDDPCVRRPGVPY